MNAARFLNFRYSVFIILISAPFLFTACKSADKKTDSPEVVRWKEYEAAVIRLADSNPDSSFLYAGRILTEARLKNNLNWIARADYLIGYSFNGGNHSDSARVYSQKAITLAVELNDSTVLSDAYLLCGTSNYNLDFLKEAEKCLLTGLPYAISLKDTVKMARYYGALGSIANEYHNSVRASDYLINAKLLAEKVGNDQVLALVLRDMAILEADRGDSAAYPRLMTQALEKLWPHHDSVAIGDCYIDFAVFYYDSKPDSSYYYLQKAKQIFNKRNDTEKLIQIDFNLASLLYSKNKNQEAVRLFEQIYALTLEKHILIGQAKCLLMLNRINLELNKLDRAAYYLQKAEELQKIYNIPDFASELLQDKIGYCMTRGQYKEAIVLYKQILSLIDSLTTAEDKDQLAANQKKYELEKKVQGMILLKKQSDLQKAQVKNQKILIISMAVFILVAILLLFIIHRSYKKMLRVQQQLSESEAKLRESNATKDRFFSIIAHDLRSPFNGFLGLIHIMEAEYLNMSNSRLLEYIRLMGKSAENLFSLLENLLEWSRMQMDTIKVNPEPFFLKSKVMSILELNNETAAAKNIMVDCALPEQLKVFADARMFDGIVRNLVSNALKFTPNGGRVTITARETDPGFIELAVSDTGIGMDQEILGNLFKLDKKVNRKGTAGESSSGLGMILCREFVENNGGTLHIESTVGVGSTFTVRLPRADRET